MKIALLTYSTKPRGGVVHTLALAEALTRTGCQVDVWTLGRGGDLRFFRDVEPAVGLRIVPFPDFPGEGVGERILRSIAVLGAAFPGSSSYDVVHAQDCITANAVRGRCVRTVHHLDNFTTPELAACHERAIVQPIAHICVSAAVAAEVHTGWGLSPTVIPNGVDAAPFAAAASPHPAAAATRRAWRDRFGHFVLAVGGIEPRKGTLDLVAAMSRLPGIRLVVAGGETLFDYRPYRASVDALVASLGVPLELLGPVPQADLPGLVAAAGAFAFPSTKEGFGLAAMEALAAGVPVVARDLPVLREVFGSAVRFAGDGPDFPAALAAELEVALAGPDPARAAAGRALAASYSWDTAAKAHLALYNLLGR